MSKKYIKPMGFFIYYDEDKVIYSHILMGNRGKILQEKDRKTYTVFQKRTLSSILLTVFGIYVLKWKLLPSILLGLCFYLLTSLLFLNFLKSLETIDSFKKEKQFSFRLYASRQRVTDVLAALLGCFCLLAVSLSGVILNKNPDMFSTNCLIASVSLLYFIFLIAVIVSISKQATERYYQSNKKQ